MRRTALTLCLLASAAFGARVLVAMQAPAANYDESKIPAYTLPDPLVLDNGGKVASARDWTSTRRPELLARFATVEYGRTPTATLPVTAKVDEEGPAFGGSAMRRQVTLHFGPPQGGLDMHLLLYLPAKATEPVPAFLALNFQGNQAVASDAAIGLATSWLPNRDPGVVNHRATDAARGTEAVALPDRSASSRAATRSRRPTTATSIPTSTTGSRTACIRCSTRRASRVRPTASGARLARGRGG